MKKFNYVQVKTTNGFKLVTKTEKGVAYWDNVKPLAMSKSVCDDIVTGLSWNGYTAGTLTTIVEITEQF